MSDVITSTNNLSAEATAAAQRKLLSKIEGYEAKYPHLAIKRESWRFDPNQGNGGKLGAEIKCPECGNYHFRWSSDFHQAQCCPECKAAADKAKKGNKAPSLSIAQLKEMLAKAEAAEVTETITESIDAVTQAPVTE